MIIAGSPIYKFIKRSQEAWEKEQKKQQNHACLPFLSKPTNPKWCMNLTDQVSGMSGVR